MVMYIGGGGSCRVFARLFPSLDTGSRARRWELLFSFPFALELLVEALYLTWRQGDGVWAEGVEVHRWFFRV